MVAWWTRRSMAATVIASFGKIRSQALKGTLAAMARLRFSYRRVDCHS